MAKAIVDLSTAGIRMGYAIEATSGTRPTTGYTNIPHPKEIPDLSPQPNALDTSHLNIEAGGFKTYIEGLKDMGGSLAITMSMSAQLLTDWNTFVENAKTARAEGKRAWFVFYHPELEQSFFMAGEPVRLDFPAASVDAVWEATVYIMPVDVLGWETAVNPTDPV